MPKSNGYGKIAKRILILHSRANKLQADLLALESLVSDEAKKAERGTAKGKSPAAKAPKQAARGRKPALASKAAAPARSRTLAAPRRSRKPAAQ